MRVLYFGRRIQWILCFVAASVLFSGTSAHAFLTGKITKFTADEVMIDANGKIQHEGKIYVMPNKVRVEGIVPKGDEGMNMIWIFRRDKKIAWYLNSDKKLYMEKPLDEKEMEKYAKKYVDSKNEKVLGTEKINGYECTKKEVVTTTNFMGYKNTSKSIAWISKKLDMPIRTQSQDGSINELRNIKEHSTSAKYFEVPKDYKQVSNMMELIGINMGEFKTERSKTEEPKTESSKAAEENKDSGLHLPFKLPKGITDIFKKGNQ